MKSKVYYSDLRTGFNNSLIDKLTRLMEKAGIADIDFTNQYVAIKMHFGEPGNLAFLRPNWAKCVATRFMSEEGRMRLIIWTAQISTVSIRFPLAARS